MRKGLGTRRVVIGSEKLTGRAGDRQGHRQGRGSEEKAAFWLGHLQGWRRDGGSIRGYCRRHGLSEPSFYAWRRQLEQRQANRVDEARSAAAIATGTVAGPVSKPPAFVRVAVVDDPQALRRTSPAESVASAGIEIVLPTGAVMRVASGVDRTLWSDTLAVLMNVAGTAGSEVVGC